VKRAVRVEYIYSVCRGSVVVGARAAVGLGGKSWVKLEGEVEKEAHRIYREERVARSSRTKGRIGMKGGKWERGRRGWIWKEEGSSVETRRRQYIVGLLLVNVEARKVITLGGGGGGMGSSSDDDGVDGGGSDGSGDDGRVVVVERRVPTRRESFVEKRGARRVRTRGASEKEEKVGGESRARRERNGIEFGARVRRTATRCGGKVFVSSSR